MPKLSEFLGDTATCTVKAGKTTVTLTYHVFYERQFPDGEWEKLKELKGREYFLALLPRVVVDWDIVGDDDKPIPCTREGIEAAKLPDKFLLWCDLALAEAEERGKAKSGS